ncbi:unnamed protein product [Rangifer tarandus platyrhynchus]|uniref:Uncharacterized protein n=2 Tax=Rangifer tarandus platyrhynchus TaxID=3082113 RepID=A0ACB0ENT8_RANTA|nr:unnamed protein product [Rangifer tarandus platyrhynchus]CAI9702422.1 unnamed protein product [Rangifer tarandus platyrhynchus]
MSEYSEKSREGAGCCCEGPLRSLAFLRSAAESPVTGTQLRQPPRAPALGRLHARLILGLLEPFTELLQLRLLSRPAASRHGGSFAAEHGFEAPRPQQLQREGSVVEGCGLGCPVVCAVFLDQGSNPRARHWRKALGVAPGCPQLLARGIDAVGSGGLTGASSKPCRHKRRHGVRKGVTASQKASRRQTRRHGVRKAIMGAGSIGCPFFPPSGPSPAARASLVTILLRVTQSHSRRLQEHRDHLLRNMALRSCRPLSLQDLPGLLFPKSDSGTLDQMARCCFLNFILTPGPQLSVPHSDKRNTPGNRASQGALVSRR